MAETKREAVLRVFTEYGFGPGSDPHSWRCYHPDRYGECTCASELADAVLDALRPDRPRQPLDAYFG